MISETISKQLVNISSVHDAIPYIPYNVEIHWEGYSRIVSGINLNTHELITTHFNEEEGVYETFPIFECQLALRPITELHKPIIDESGKEIIPIMELVKLLWDKHWVLESSDELEQFANTPYYYHMGLSKIYVRYYKGQLVSYDDKGLLAFHGLTVPMINLLNKLHFNYGSKNK